MPIKNQVREAMKARGLRRRHERRAGMGICILVLILLVFVLPVNALKQPYDYEDNQCELIAKDYQDIFYGDLIFIQPLKDNGAYDFGAYNGHWINKAWNKELGIYYIDYGSQTYLYTIEEIKQWYEIYSGKKSEVFNINQGEAPFAIRYHY